MAEQGRPGPREFEAAGLYDPDAPDAEDRLALLEYLASIGATIDDFALVQDFELPALASTIGLFPKREFISIDEAAGRAGLTPDMLRRVWRAAGFADVAPDEELLLTTDADLLAGMAAGVEFFGEELVMQFVRLLGTAAARVADAGVSAFAVTAVEDAIASDPSFVELARANYEAVALVPVLVSAFDMLLRHHLHVARRFDNPVVEGVEVLPRSIAFVDLVDSTQLVASLPPSKLASALATFEETASDIIAARGGRLVKTIGDEVMFSAPDPAVATGIACALVDAFAHHDALPPVRAGIATGDVVSQAGDVSGTVVHLAARAVKIADAGTLLVDEATCRGLPVPMFEVRPAGQFTLKGFTEPVSLFAVSPGERSERPRG